MRDEAGVRAPPLPRRWPVSAFIGRRLLRSLATIFIVSIVAFAVEHVLPGSPAGAILGDEASPRAIARLNAQLGFDRPVVIQYLSWARGFLTGHLGQDYQSGVSVAHLLKSAAEPTCELALLSIVLSMLIGLPLGIAAGYWRGRWLDGVVSTISALGLSVPAFWLGMILVILFGVKWQLLPVYGYVPPQQNLLENLKTILLPTMSLAGLHLAVLARFTRSGMVEVMGSDYIRTARAKGLRELVVLWRHAFRNAMAVPLTVIGLIVSYTIGGVVVVEFLFSIPGLGRLAVTSVLGRELAVVQAIMVLSALIVVCSNLAVDVGYRLLDPRVGSL